MAQRFSAEFSGTVHDSHLYSCAKYRPKDKESCMSGPWLSSVQPGNAKRGCEALRTPSITTIAGLASRDRCEFLQPASFGIDDVDVALRVDCQIGRIVELAVGSAGPA